MLYISKKPYWEQVKKGHRDMNWYDLVSSADSFQVGGMTTSYLSSEAI